MTMGFDLEASCHKDHEDRVMTALEEPDIDTSDWGFVRVGTGSLPHIHTAHQFFSSNVFARIKGFNVCIQVYLGIYPRQTVVWQAASYIPNWENRDGEYQIFYVVARLDPI